MSDDRLAQARAEAGRTMSRMPFGQARIGYEAGHEHGVEWADANPQPHTITRSALRAVLDLHQVARYPVPEPDGSTVWEEWCAACGRPTPCPTVTAIQGDGGGRR